MKRSHLFTFAIIAFIGGVVALRVGLPSSLTTNAQEAGTSRWYGVEADLPVEPEVERQKKPITVTVEGTALPMVTADNVSEEDLFASEEDCNPDSLKKCLVVISKEDGPAYTSEDETDREQVSKYYLEPFVVTGSDGKRVTRYMGVLPPLLDRAGKPRTGLNAVVIGQEENDPSKPLGQVVVPFDPSFWSLPEVSGITASLEQVRDVAVNAAFKIASLAMPAIPTSDGGSGQCTPIVSSGTTRPWNILIVNPNGAVDPKIAQATMSAVFTYKPLDQNKKQFQINARSTGDTVPCLNSVSADGRSECAQEILQRLGHKCAAPADLIIVESSEASASWKSAIAPVVVVSTALKEADRAAIIANAIASQFGLGDEFEYDESTAQLSRQTLNCRLGGKLGDAKDVAKGCGDFPQVGNRPAQESIMGNPLKFTGNPEGFGAINQKLLKIIFDALP